MITCTICHFATELDDVVVTTATGHRICLRCFARETGSARPMPDALQREITAVLAEAEATEAG